MHACELFGRLEAGLGVLHFECMGLHVIEIDRSHANERCDIQGGGAP